jgi:hypothetical protein
MLDVRATSQRVAGEDIVLPSKSAASGAGYDPLGPGILDPDGGGPPVTRDAEGYDIVDKESPLGVVALEIPREVIARFSGSLILNELPERQPEIVFDRGRQFRDDDDE